MFFMPTSDHMVYVIDDDDRVREALEGLLAAAGFNSTLFASAAEYICHPRVEGPACLVVDVGLAGTSGLDLQTQIAERSHPPIVFITGKGDVHSSVRAMKAGAIDFLTKPFVEKELLAAISVAISQDRRRLEARGDLSELEHRRASLTPREREVMSLVVTGLLNKQAAALLGISEVTLQIHRGKVMKKMKAASLANLVRMADALGLPAQLKRNDSDREWSKQDYG